MELIRRIKQALIFIMLVCCTHSSYAAIADSIAVKKSNSVDGRYITPFSRTNAIEIYYGSSGFNLTYASLNDRETPSHIFSGNSSAFIGAAFSYKFLSFDYSFDIPHTELAPDQSRTIRSHNIGVSNSWRKVYARVYYTDYNGFLSEYKNQVSGVDRDLRFLTFGGRAIYNFKSRRYSYKSAIGQTERQRRSAGSFLLMAEGYYRLIRSNFTILPDSLTPQELYGKYHGLRRSGSVGLDVLPGYGANVVFGKGKFYFSPVFFLGGGVGDGQFTTADADFNRLHVDVSLRININLGYNGSRVYVNLKFVSDNVVDVFDPSYFSLYNYSGVLTVGYRVPHVEKWLPEDIKDIFN